MNEIQQTILETFIIFSIGMLTYHYLFYVRLKKAFERMSEIAIEQNQQVKDLINLNKELTQAAIELLRSCGINIDERGVSK